MMSENRIPPLSTLKQFCNKYIAFTEGGMRDRIFYADSNGLKQCGAILRNGRRILIDEEKFFHWLQEQNA